MPTSPVCVDASILIKLAAPEPDRPLALALWQRWLNADRQIVAPYLLPFEVTSAIWQKARRRVVSEEEARTMIEKLLALGVRLLHPSDLSLHAFDLAVRCRLNTVYDAHYLALAEMLEADFWTADERLYNSTKADFPTVHWLGETAE